MTHPTLKEKQKMASNRLARMSGVMKSGYGKFPYGEGLYLVAGRVVDRQAWDRHCDRENRLIDRGIGVWN